MPSTLHASSARSDGAARPWLLIGLSVRALAQAAARGGYPACAVDAFADRDTAVACAGRVAKLPVDASYRIEPATLAETLAATQRRFAPHGFAGIITGSGFDGRPQLLTQLAAIAPLAGCDAATMRNLREPRSWFVLLDALGVAHPPVRFDVPNSARGWIIKSASGSGGWHVRPWHRARQPASDDYFQRRRRGRPGSVLFVANGSRARVLGWQWQLHAPSPELPWRYGGVITANDLPALVRAEVTTALTAIIERVPLRGLAGLDFLVDGNSVEVLELNPRPTASIALYRQHDLFGMHLAACAGSLPQADLATGAQMRGEAVLYAPRPLRLSAEFLWPDGCADIPSATGDFAFGDPVCTVRAQADSVHSLRLRLAHRLRSTMSLLLEKQIHEHRHPERERAGSAPRTGAAG